MMESEEQQEPLTVTAATEKGKRVDEFDEILELIGTKGSFQKFLLYAIVCPIIGLLPLALNNTMFMHNELDHWCYHEIMDTFNSSQQLNEWKEANLPIESGPDGVFKFSRCTMYADAESELDRVGDGDRHKLTNLSRPVINCPKGWAYDKSKFTSSINSDFDWVCSRQHYLTTVYTAMGVGHVIGALIFGILADKFGRKPVLFIGLSLFVSFRILCLLVPSQFPLYVTLVALSSIGAQPIYSITTLVIAEMCDDGFRSWTYSFTSIIWVSGVASIPYVAYACQSWLLLGAVTTLPCLALLFYISIFPESPRWLISVGRIDEGVAVIKQIAVKNGTEAKVSDEKLKEVLRPLVRTQIDENPANGGHKIGVWTLFSKRYLAKHMILLTLSMVASSFLYGGILLNTPNLPGDLILNFSLLSIIEIPSNCLGDRLVDSLGRRWTAIAFYGISGVACLIAALSVLHPHLSIIVTASVLVSKFSVTITYLVVSLQITELLPTPLRFTGNSFAATVAGLVALGSPGMVYLGNFYAPSPYVIMGCLAFAAMMGSAFLPETLGQHLPETINAANNFGRGNRFWSLRPRAGRVQHGTPAEKESQASGSQEKECNQLI